MKSVLITGGGCEEAIDSVRSVCNFSSGKTSSALAEIFSAKGWNVTLLAGKRAFTPPNQKGIEVIRFSDFKNLSSLIEEKLQIKKYDGVIHAAAVSDFSVKNIVVDGKKLDSGENKKISSDGEILITLKPNPKILPTIKKQGKNIFIVGFKLTTHARPKERKTAVEKLFKQGNTDLVVSNDLSEISQSKHYFKIYNDSGETVSEGKTKEEMGYALLELISKGAEK